MLVPLQASAGSNCVLGPLLRTIISTEHARYGSHGNKFEEESCAAFIPVSLAGNFLWSESISGAYQLVAQDGLHHADDDVIHWTS